MLIQLPIAIISQLFLILIEKRMGRIKERNIYFPVKQEEVILLNVYQMRWLKIDNLEQAQKALAHIGVDADGIPHMAGKALTRVVKMEKVPLPVAHVLKQEMLSLGGDAAVHREVIVNGVEETDVLLLGNYKQLKSLVNKLNVQPFGLKAVGRSLQRLLECLEPFPAREMDCRGKKLELGRRTLIMGILNVTPDSFSDGGKFFEPEKALAQAERIIEEGADILDIGAESTRPGYEGITAEEEWSRLEPVLKAVVPHCKIPVSVDTQKAEIAEKALDAGVDMINDIWGLQKDPKMAKVIGKYKVPVIVMHNQNGTEYQNLMGDILAFLRRSIAIALEQGLAPEQVIVDPGIGFGKTPQQSIEVLSRLEELKSLGHPVLLGASRKSVIGRTLNLPVDERLEPTIAISTIGVAAGVDILRVHDVKENKKAVLMADEILRKKRGDSYEGK